jgi:prepilin-type N-terminal cleavage/methylation domain-containing protein
MRKKGFTLVELLVVIAIIAMLLAILMPALAKVKTLAYQMLCGTNLKGVANAILVYSQDNSEKYPVAGTPGSGGVTWNANGNDPMGHLYQGNNNWQWDDPTKPASNQNKATVSACLYLLVKYADVSPSSFVCKAGKQKKFNIQVSQLATAGGTNEAGVVNAASKAKDPTECWDFSNTPAKYCSYAYSYPFTGGTTSWALASSSKSGMAVAGDLNPWIAGETPTWQTPSTPANTAATPGYDSPQLIVAATKATFISGNSLTHETAGQNILFNDMHVEFCKQPNPDAAIQNDNVYTCNDSANMANIAGRQKGIKPTNTGTSAGNYPYSKEDSYLIQW